MTKGEHHSPTTRKRISKGIKAALAKKKKRSAAAKASWDKRRALKEGPRTEQLQPLEINPAQLSVSPLASKPYSDGSVLWALTTNLDNFTEAYIKLTREYFADVRTLVDDLEQQTLGGHR